MKLGLRARLALLLAAFGVLATGLTGWYAYEKAREMLLQSAQRDLVTTTTVFGRRLGAVFGRIAADAREAAQLRLAERMASGEATAEESALLTDAFRAMLVTNPRYLQFRLISADRHGLELVRIDRDGTAAIEVGGDDLQEKAHLPYVFQALQLHAGQVFLSKIGLDHETGSHAAFNQPLLHVSSPVIDSHGHALGVVVIGVDVKRVFDDLRGDMPGYLKMLLANEWGDYLIHPDASQAFAFEQGRRVLLQDTFPEAAPLLGQPGGTVLAEAEFPEGSGSYPAVGAFTRLKLAPEAVGGDVVLGIAEPVADIFHSTRELAGTIVQIVVALSALAMGLALLAAGLVTRPLKQMTREVQRYTTEKKLGELPVERSDEIGELARGFRQMQRSVNATLSELEASRERLADQASRDPLTGLPNRAAFIERVSHAIASARRRDQSLALLFVDLDRFKRVNDQFGHAVGDRVLQHAALMLRHAVREADTVGRIGGDEFVILLEAVHDERDAGRVAQTLIERFAEPIEVDGMPVDLGLSIGIAVCPRDGSDAGSLMQKADEAMYRSKSGSGNRYSVFGNL